LKKKLWTISLNYFEKKLAIIAMNRSILFVGQVFSFLLFVAHFYEIVTYFNFKQGAKTTGF